MKIIFNTFKYGNARTRFALLLMATGLLAGFGMLAYSLIVANYIVTMTSVVLLIADVCYIMSTDFRNLIIPGQNKQHRKKEKKLRVKNDNEDEGGALDWISSEKKKKPSQVEKISEYIDEDEKNDGKDDEKAPKKKIPDVNPLTLYDQKKYKKLFIEYKVKQEHVLILIDNCMRERITECPAILWKDKTTAYILLLEAEPRMIKFNMYDYNEMHIRAAVDADPDREYKDFKEHSFLGKLFTPLLPNYTKTDSGNGRKSICKKALYGIGPDIFCTSNSVKNIIQVLSLNMVLTESKIQKGSYSDWFKRIYISRLMYRDKIFSAPEYQAQVMGILDQMAEKASDDDFSNSITQMLLGGLIPQEYAEYANFKRK